MENDKKCQPGFRWCDKKQECVPEEEKGHEQPYGPSFNEAEELVDELLMGIPSKHKIMKEVDDKLNEVENELDNVPDQDIESLQDDVVDELSKDKEQKDEEKEEEIEHAEEEMSVEESMKNSVQLLVKEEEYREFFKGMLKKWNIKSPSDLDGDKKKEFFNIVDKEWKAKKESD